MFSLIRQLFPYRVHSELKQIYASIALKRFAFGMVGIFEPIYFFTLFHEQAAPVFLYFGSMYLLQMFLIPLGAKALPRLGVKHSIALSMPLTFLYYLILRIQGDELQWAFLVSAFFLAALYRMFFWNAYHIGFARRSEKGERGREFSLTQILNRGVLLIAPAVGGLIVANYGFPVLFTAVLVVLVAAMIPLFFSPDWKETYTEQYTTPFKKLVQRNHWRHALGSFAIAFKMVTVIMWPIFMFVYDIQFEEIGLVASLSAVAVIICSLVLGRISDKGHSRLLLQTGIWAKLGMDILRMAPRTVGHFFAIGFGAELARQVQRFGFYTYLYNIAEEEEQKGDEYLIFFRVAAQLGKATGLLMAAAIITTLPVTSIWILFGLFAPANLLLFRLFREMTAGNPQQQTA